MGLETKIDMTMKREWPRNNSWELHINNLVGNNDFVKDRIIEHCESGHAANISYRTARSKWRF